MSNDNILEIIREQIISLSKDPQCIIKVFMFSDTEATIVNNDPQDAPGKSSLRLVINKKCLNASIDPIADCVSVDI
jgi:hypothetical protein